jgi:hypothetical protein
MNVLCYVQARFCLVGDPKHMAWDELDDLDVWNSKKEEETKNAGNAEKFVRLN